MNEDKIAALDIKQLRTLLVNARQKDSVEAARIIGLAEKELERRAAKKVSHRTSQTTWTKHGGSYAHAGDSYECRMGEKVVATIRKVSNHSQYERHIYESTVQGKKFDSFEKVNVGKQKIEAELLRLGLLIDD